MLFSHGVMVCHIIFRGAVEKTFSTVLSVRKRCGVLHRKDTRQSVPVFASQMVEIREILWVWKRKVIRQTTQIFDDQSLLLPVRYALFKFFTPMDGGIVHHDNGLLRERLTKGIKTPYDHTRVDRLFKHIRMQIIVAIHKA